MKWLEGWFGTASGVLGILWMVIVALLVPTTVHSGYSCMSSDGSTTCYGPNGAPMPTTAAAPGPNVGLLILVGVTILLYLGVLVGTWLDLRGARRMGRVILLTSATLLIFAPFLFIAATTPISGISFAYTFPLTLLAIVAGILASVRSDAPRPVAQG